MQEFQALHIPIQGINLIEASAGTGKTYGIAALFTRLIVLERKTPSRLLVLTFSNAAAAELKKRLRSRLQEVLHIMRAGEDFFQHELVLNDDFLHHLFELWSNGTETYAELMLRLQAALNEFDNAGIYTIHGFCRSLLSDEAFLCNVPFQIENNNEQERLIEQICQDFWRKNVSYQKDNAELCMSNNLTVSEILENIRPYINQTYLNTQIERQNWREKEQTYQQLLDKIKQCPQVPDEIITQTLTDLKNTKPAKKKSELIEKELVTAYQTRKAFDFEEAFYRIHPQLNGNVFRLKSYSDLFNSLISDIDKFKDIDKADKLNLLDKLAKFIHENTINFDKETIATLAPLSELGVAWRELLIDQAKAINNLYLEMLQSINQGLANEKKRSKQRSFDDLLLDVHQVLKNKDNQLASKLASTWDMLLVDEFQDTDPIQYEIFKLGFAEKNIPLFLVGDPKQAIYRFRGADISTYLQAASDAGERVFTLKTNYRSHQDLLDVFAAFFARPEPFIHQKIAYPDVCAKRKHSNLSPTLPAMEIYTIDSEEKISAEEYRKEAANICANHIVNLLNLAQKGEQRNKDKPLENKDIAILVNSHSEAKLMADTLRNKNLSSVLMQRQSVFDTDEAQMLSALLRLWLNPQKNGLLRFVLIGLFNYSAQQIQELNEDDQEMSKHAQISKQALIYWQEQGIFSAWQYFIKETQLEINLIRRRADRTLTNLGQLIEILATEESQLFGTNSLLVWLDNAISQAKIQKNSNQLRLESDENLITIMTIHKSKGLQFPIVYYPFLLSNDKKLNKLNKINDNGTFNLLFKEQIDKNEEAIINNENLSEKLRLFYVALTRAEDTFISCLKTQEAKAEDKKEKKPITSVLGYLLSLNNNEPSFADLSNWKNTLPNPEILLLSNTKPPEVELKSNHTPNNSFQVATLKKQKYSAQRTSSFSALAQQNQRHENSHTSEEYSPLDKIENDTPISAQISEQNNAHNLAILFPPGAKTGLCWHEIIEHFHFEKPAEDQKTMIEKILEKYKLNQENAVNSLLPMLDILRQIPLANGQSLNTIPANKRLAEMGFLMYQAPINEQQLTQHFAPMLPEIICQNVRQFSLFQHPELLNGFIDLICIDKNSEVYIIDYKSNYLGAQPANYQNDALNQAMAQHHYAVQAIIYAYAVKRYLSKRNITPKAFHIRYIFLRGLSTDNPQNGIWSWDLSCDNLPDQN